MAEIVSPPPASAPWRAAHHDRFPGQRHRRGPGADHPRASGADEATAAAAAQRVFFDAEEAELRALGDAVGGVDEEGLEGDRRSPNGRFLVGLRLAVAESLTGGLVAARLTSVPGASEWFAGGVVSYGEDVKRALLGVGDGPVVSVRRAAAEEMAAGVRALLRADLGLSLTGVAGPTTQDDQPVGTVFVGLVGAAGDGPGTGGGAGKAEVTQLSLRGDRQLVRSAPPRRRWTSYVGA